MHDIICISKTWLDSRIHNGEPFNDCFAIGYDRVMRISAKLTGSVLLIVVKQHFSIVPIMSLTTRPALAYLSCSARTSVS